MYHVLKGKDLTRNKNSLASCISAQVPMEREHCRKQIETPGRPRCQQDPAPFICQRSGKRAPLLRWMRTWQVRKNDKAGKLLNSLFVLIIFSQIGTERWLHKVPLCVAVSSGKEKLFEMALAAVPSSSISAGLWPLQLAPTVNDMGTGFHPFTLSLLSSWRIITFVSLLITSSNSQQIFSPLQQFLPNHNQTLRFSNGHRSSSNNASTRLIAQSYSIIKEHKIIMWRNYMSATSRSASPKFSKEKSFP